MPILTSGAPESFANNARFQAKLHTRLQPARTLHTKLLARCVAPARKSTTVPMRVVYSKPASRTACSASAPKSHAGAMNPAAATPQAASSEMPMSNRRLASPRPKSKNSPSPAV